MKNKLFVKEHVLMPKHLKMGVKEKEDILKKYNITINELPKIKKSDPAIVKLETKPGDVIKIIRKSATAEEAIFYRCVVNV